MSAISVFIRSCNLCDQPQHAIESVLAPTQPTSRSSLSMTASAMCLAAVGLLDGPKRGRPLARRSMRCDLIGVDGLFCGCASGHSEWILAGSTCRCWSALRVLVSSVGMSMLGRDHNAHTPEASVPVGSRGSAVLSSGARKEAVT